MLRTEGWRRSSAAMALAVLAVACGGEGATTSEPEPTATVASTPATPAAAATRAAPVEVQITARDYEYVDLPTDVEAGSVLQIDLVNESTVEAHEAVIYRLDEGDTRTAEDFVALPYDELVQSLPPYQGLAFAFPGEESDHSRGTRYVGPSGRYLIVCELSVGTDLGDIRAAFAKDQPPPKVDGAQLHYQRGMAAVLELSGD